MNILRNIVRAIPVTYGLFYGVRHFMDESLSSNEKLRRATTDIVEETTGYNLSSQEWHPDHAWLTISMLGIEGAFNLYDTIKTGKLDLSF